MGQVIIKNFSREKLFDLREQITAALYAEPDRRTFELTINFDDFPPSEVKHG